MNDLERIQHVMRDIGPMDDDILAVVQTADDRWAVRFDDVDVDIELDTENERLMLSTTIGPAPAKRLETVYATLLTYSMLWRETGGIRMAMTNHGGDVLQMIELATSRLTPALLTIVAGNLCARTRIWRAFFITGVLPDIPADFTHEIMIRV
jgi:hypothetical protein